MWARALQALNAAELRLQACTGRLQELQSMFDNQMAEKKRIEDGAMALQRKMNQVMSRRILFWLPLPYTQYSVVAVHSRRTNTTRNISLTVIPGISRVNPFKTALLFWSQSQIWVSVPRSTKMVSPLPPHRPAAAAALFAPRDSSMAKGVHPYRWPSGRAHPLDGGQRKIGGFEAPAGRRLRSWVRVCFVLRPLQPGVQAVHGH